METFERQVRALRAVRVLLTTGVVTAAVAGAGLTGHFASADQLRHEPSATPQPQPAPETPPFMEGDVSVVNMVYEPGQSSGWHVHDGIHAVAVMSGTLTVYDEWCERRTYSSGTPYVGGQRWHLARNESDAPVEMVVTYLKTGSNVHHPAAGPPRPCGVE